MTQEQLINIPLGESVVDGAWDILRVVGGWVYSQLFFEENGFSGPELVTTSAITSIFVPEPKPVASRFIQLTNEDGKKVLVNIDNVATISQVTGKGCIICYSGDNDYYERVKESYDEIMAVIKENGY